MPREANLTADRIQSFPPISSPTATVLILGSIPGERSLGAGEYYAHPQNGFWRILGRLIGVSPNAPYETRIQALKLAKIAVWDVVHSCERKGSLDSDIRPGSITLNDFDTFFDQHPNIKLICFNGAKAETCFKKQIHPLLTNAQGKQYLKLPSTSPAHTLSLEKKIEAWSEVVRIQQNFFLQHLEIKSNKHDNPSST